MCNNSVLTSIIHPNPTPQKNPTSNNNPKNIPKNWKPEATTFHLATSIPTKRTYMPHKPFKTLIKIVLQWLANF
jgi:hypothetical protein